VILKDSGHWPFQDDPQRVEAAVVPFLRRQLAAGVPG
jgi:pimeloyl-ACP methyl ester carboxylesterase